MAAHFGQGIKGAYKLRPFEEARTKNRTEIPTHFA